MQSTIGNKNTLPFALFASLLLVLLVNILILPRSWSIEAIINIKNYSLVAVCLICWISVLFDRQFNVVLFKIDVVFLAFIVWNFASYTWAINPSLVLENSFAWLFLFCLFKLFSSIDLRDNRIEQLTTPIILLLAFNLIILCWRFSYYIFLEGNLGISHSELKQLSKYLHANTNSIASLLVLTAPCYVLLYHRCKRSKLFVIMAVAQLILIFMLNARGATLALVAQFGLFLILYSNSLKKLKWMLLITPIALCAMVFMIEDRQAFFDQYNPLKGISSGHDERLILWKSSTKVWQDNKLSGVGVGNWIIEYPKHAQELHFGYDDERYYSHPHNIYVHIATELGSVGIVLYLFVLVYFLYLYYHELKKPREGSAIDVLLLIFVGYLILSFFYGVVYSWSGIPVIHQVIFWASLGLGLRLSDSTSIMQVGNLIKYLCVGMMVLFTVFYVFISQKNTLKQQLYTAERTKDKTTALQLLDRLYDARFYTMDGRTNRNTALKTHEALLRFKEDNDVNGGIEAMQQAIVDQPNYHINYYHLGIMFKKKGDLDQAQTCFEKVYALKNSYVKAQFELIRIHIKQKNQEQAQKWHTILNDQISFILSMYAVADEEKRKLQNDRFYKKCLWYQKQLKKLSSEISGLNSQKKG